MTSASQARRDDRSAGVSPPMLIGVGVDGGPGGRDAIVLSSMLARATDAELMLIAVHVAPITRFVEPEGLDSSSLRKQVWADVANARDALAPEARIEVQSDAVLWRGLRHVVRFQHADMLVVGSSSEAREGHGRLGRHARELQEHLERPLAIAPRGVQHRPKARLERIGVGFDGRPESQAAVRLSGCIAVAAGAELEARGVVDDRVVAGLRVEAVIPKRGETVERELASLSEHAHAAARGTGAQAQIDVAPGRPTDALRELCGQVDLLVIGSSHSAPPGRIMLGSTGEALLRDAPGPVLVVPRPLA
jgi:nucleotide-binding universal stress UspA family protein